MKLPKIITIALASVLFTACAPKIYYTTQTSIIDYQAYANEGFFLTESNAVSFDYTPIGSVFTIVESGIANEKQVPSRFKTYDFEGKPMMETVREWKSASPDDAIQAAIADAKAKGANGIINLKISSTSYVAKNGKQAVTITLTGMAIKR